MWIVALALRRPYTFVVVALLLLILGPIVIFRTPTDIFPNIDIPVVSILWNYTGLNSEDMANRIVSQTERTLTTTVDNIQHSESQSLNGIAVVKVFFQPHANIERAIAQITAISQTQLRQLPPGTTPPLIITYNASSVPILQLALSGQKLSEQQLFDYGVNFIRTQLVTIPGCAIPYPYGGKQRQVQVDLDTNALQSKGLSPLDVVNAISAQNLILPSGTSKIGLFEYAVDLNGSPQAVSELNDLPIKTVGSSTIYIRDVGFVRDGFPPQTNIVRVNGQRASLLTVLKSGNASTLDIISGIKSLLPQIQAGLPPELNIQQLADQSLFVRASINGVLREGIIAACLTGLMILIFLGSWRSTIIIAVSIPLSILTSIIVMSALGETINIMTLGGLALAVGILVDDATVEIENINRNIAQGKEIQRAILDGAQQIAVPAFVSTLAICIVFVPMFFLAGVARYLFVPLAEAVVFAMLASYLLSRTLVPTMAKYLLKGHEQEAGHLPGSSRNPLVRLQARFEEAFERFRERYHQWLDVCLQHRGFFLGVFFAACVCSLLLLVPWLGEDFFPSVDSGQFKLHLRARTGTRIEETARLCDLVEQSIHDEIPGSEISSIIDNIGLPYSSINLSYSNSAPIGSSDADILVTLSPKHRPTEEYVRDLRRKLPDEFPGVSFAFLPADIVSQILNFGLPSPIDDRPGDVIRALLLAHYRLRNQPGLFLTALYAGVPDHFDLILVFEHAAGTNAHGHHVEEARFADQRGAVGGIGGRVRAQVRPSAPHLASGAQRSIVEILEDLLGRRLSTWLAERALKEIKAFLCVTETAAQTDKRNDVLLSVHVLGRQPGVPFVAAVESRHLLVDRVKLGALLRLHLDNKLVEVRGHVLPRRQTTRQRGQKHYCKTSSHHGYLPCGTIIRLYGVEFKRNYSPSVSAGESWM